MLNLIECYELYKNEAMYLDNKIEYSTKFLSEYISLKNRADNAREAAILHVCHFEIEDSNTLGLLDLCVPARILIYMALFMFCRDKDYYVVKVYDMVKSFINENIFDTWKDYFHEEDQKLLEEDFLIAKQYFG